jgi:plastocyanin
MSEENRMVRTRSALILSFFGALIVPLAGCPEDKPAAPPPAPAAPPPASAAPAAAPAAAPGAPAAAPGAPAAAPAAGGATGSIKGAVAFTGTAPAPTPLKREADAFCGKTKMNDEQVLVNGNKTLKNVLVRLSNVAGTFPAPAAAAEIKQDNCMYRPRVQAIVAGQAISIKNGDQTLHNVHTYKGAATLFNQAQLAGSPAIEKKFSDSGAVIKFKCDVHPWMTGYVAVNQNPFFAVTGEDGSFELKDVPAGKYTVEAWHEKFGMKSAEVTVAAGAPAEAKFSFDGTETAK